MADRRKDEQIGFIPEITCLTSLLHAPGSNLGGRTECPEFLVDTTGESRDSSFISITIFCIREG
jgi:hypothetical protein